MKKDSLYMETTVVYSNARMKIRNPHKKKIYNFVLIMTVYIFTTRPSEVNKP